MATQAGRASGVSDTRESKMASHNSISRALGAAGGGSGPSAQELADLVPRDPGDAYKPKKGEAAASAGTAPEEVDLDAALRSMR